MRVVQFLRHGGGNNMRKLLVLFIAAMCFSACSEDNSFMEYSNETLVVNIVKDSVFVNDKGVASVSRDYQEKGLLVDPIARTVRSFAQKTNDVHLRFNTGDKYYTFFNTVATLGMAGVIRDVNVEFVVGNTYDKPIKMQVLSSNDECEEGPLQFMLRKKRTKLSDIDYEYMQKKSEECREKYMKMTIIVTERNDYIEYSISSNLLPFNETFKTEEDLIDAVSFVQSRRDIKNKVDKDRVLFGATKKIPMGLIAPVLEKLQEKNLLIRFASIE